MAPSPSRPSKPHLPTGAGTARAAFWIGLYLCAVVAPLVVLLPSTSPAGSGFAWETGIGFGFAGLAMMAVQFLLTARFRRAAAPFGIDLIYYFHRYLAYGIVFVVLLHPLLLAWAKPAILASYDPREASWAMRTGFGSVLLLVAMVAVSAGRKLLRLPYEAWRISHLALAVGAVGLGFAHMAGIAHASASPLVRTLWIGIGLSLATVVLWVRLLRPLLLLQRPWRVESVRREQGSAWTLTLVPDGHAGFSFQAGQFVWITLRHSPFAMREHPFSIASAPGADGRLAFTIKELGDFTRLLGEIETGEKAYVDGPYGAFSFERHPEASGYAFIAGGIGISPMAGMLRALAQSADKRPLLLVSANASLDRMPLREEMEDLVGKLDLSFVPVLEDPPEGWQGERGYVTEEILARHLPPPPERRGWHCFLCGPLPMTRSVEKALRRLGIPAGHIHVELFDMA
jgi:predicted ferric reductase